MRIYPLFVGVASTALLLGCIQTDPPTTTEEHTPPVSEKPLPVPVVDCEPGGMYVCDCGDGNLGNKFCSWTGDSFSDCMLCGNGAEYIKDTGIACDENPTTGQPPIHCPAVPDGCTKLVCYSKSCWEATALPRTALADTSTEDCAVMMCDGLGNAVPVPDPLDCSGACDENGVCKP